MVTFAYVQDRKHKQDLVETSWWRHGSLDSETAHVLPALLQQRYKVVDGQHNVTNQLILSHSHVSDCYTHAQHLLQLEFDGGLCFDDLGVQVVSMRDRCWEFTSYSIVSTNLN
jgi:hypothetical protein